MSRDALIRKFRYFVFAALAFGASACGSEKPPEFGLLDEQGSSEADELRKLQMVRIFDHDPSGGEPQWKELSPENLISSTHENNYLYQYCRRRAGTFGAFAPCFSGITIYDEEDPSCRPEVCETNINVCMTHLLLDVAGIRATPLVLDMNSGVGPLGMKFEIPVQSSATNSSMLRTAVRTAHEASVQATKAMMSAVGLALTSGAESECTPEGLAFPYGSGRGGTYLANALVESYYLRREAVFKAADAIASYADFRSAHPSLGQRVEVGLLADELSRSDAAHLLIGGDLGLPSEFKFCTSPELTGASQTALRTLREAGVPPAVLSDTNVPLEQILNQGTSQGASVKLRLSKFWNQPNMATAEAGTIQSQLNIGVDAFQEARTYLAQELRAFSRSRVAKLSDDTIGTGTADVSRWAGTSTDPIQLPDAYYAGIAGFEDNGGFNTYDLWTVSNQADYVDALVSATARVLDTEGFSSEFDPPQQVTADEVWREIRAPLSMLQTDAVPDRLARWSYCLPPNATAFVDGMNLSDHPYMLVGEDALRCAVAGSVEGAQCQLQTTNFTTWTEGALWAVPFEANLMPLESFTKAAMAAVVLPEGVGIYLAQSDTGRPGSFKALAGMRLGSSGCQDVSVVQGLYDRVAGLIAPSPKWCSHPTEECSGGVFDQRVSLENELASDGDGVESSWKHYLTLARQAADESDALGQAYIEAGLEEERRQEGQEIQQHANDVQAIAALEELQNICGTNIDPVGLLEIFKHLQDTMSDTQVSCAVDADCEVTLPAWYKCYAGQCQLDPVSVARSRGDLIPPEQVARLEQCFDNDEIVPFVALGNQRLCLWHKTDNINEVCGGYTEEFTPEEHPCPALGGLSFAEAPSPAGCEAIQAPPGHTIVRVDEMLEYFDTANQPSGNTHSRETCDLVRKLRLYGEDGVSGLAVQDELLGQIAATDFFHPANVAIWARRLGWEARFGSYSAITVDGSPRWNTGDPWTGVQTDGWPCDADSAPARCANPAEMIGDGTGLFCHTVDCNNINFRARINNRMWRAVVALRAVALGVLEDDPPVTRDQGARRTGGTNVFDGVLGPHWELSAASLTTSDRPLVGYRQWVEHGIPVGVLGGYPGGDEVTQYMVETENPAAINAWVTPAFNYEETEGYTCVEGIDTDCIVPLVVRDLPGLFVGHTSPYTIPGTSTHYAFSEFRPTPSTEAGPPPPDALRDTGWWEGLSSFGPRVGGTVVAVATGAIPDGPALAPTHNGFFAQLLTGRRSLNAIPVPLTLENNANIPHGGGFFRPFNWEPRDLLDGIELVCEAAHSAQACDTRHPPTIDSVEELEHAKNYLQCVAGQIESRSGRTVLAKVPRRAMDALRQESAFGNFPAAGGEWGDALSSLRAAFVRVSDIQSQIAGELRGLGFDIDSLRVALARSGVQEQMADLQFMATMSNQLAACSQAMGHAVSAVGPSFGFIGGSMSAIATCANTAAQINFASELTELAAQNSLFERELQIIDFASVFSTRAQNLERQGKDILEQLAIIDGALTRIELLRSQARRALAKAIYMSSFEASNALNIDVVLRKRFNTARLRYEQAQENSRRLAFLARRAIEQRLGVRLSEMREEMPLVEPPYRWAADVCNAPGVDYSQLRNTTGLTDVQSVHGNFAEAFIGDYVTKLENFVESYRLAFDFHEGTDTSVISLRDDVHNVRAPCDVSLPNLLYHSGNFDRGPDPETSGPGWERVGCATTVNAQGLTVPVQNCIDVRSTDVAPFPATNPEVSTARTHRIFFGDGGACPPATCGLTPDTALVQRLRLPSGRYVLSWYSDVDPNIAVSNYNDVFVTGLVQIRDANGELPGFSFGSGELDAASGLTRHWFAFELSSDRDLTVEVRKPEDLHSAQIAAFMVEQANDAVGVKANRGPRAYVGTTEKLTRTLPLCEDTDGAIFRATRWERRCVLLCPDGFGSACAGSSAESHCYRETTFGINQRDIESGKNLNASGFARGNFNYRLENVAINFVGTGTRDCEDSNLPSTCHGAGFIPYSLYHNGPFFVRNHMGQDFKAALFPGRIEHARGLATERYITNPLSSADASLLEQFERQEFQGRPLDGSFALRVWEEPGVDFDAIQDVQVVLKYRYWTRFD